MKYFLFLTFWIIGGNILGQKAEIALNVTCYLDNKDSTICVKLVNNGIDIIVINGNKQRLFSDSSNYIINMEFFHSSIYDITAPSSGQIMYLYCIDAGQECIIKVNRNDSIDYIYGTFYLKLDFFRKSKLANCYENILNRELRKKMYKSKERIYSIEMVMKFDVETNEFVVLKQASSQRKFTSW